MAVGIKLTQEIKVELGEIKEKLFSDLDKSKITYDVPFDKLNNNGIKETIVHIKELETEISIENDIIAYIKSGNTEFTHLDTIEDIKTNPLIHIKTIQQRVQDLFGIDGSNVKIEKLNTTTMNITLIISSLSERARVQVLRDNTGQVYVNTLRNI